MSDYINSINSAMASQLAHQAQKETQPFKQTRELEKQTEKMQKQTDVMSELKELTKRNAELTEINMQSAEKQYNTSQYQFYSSFIISIVAIVISVVFSIYNGISSNDWQAKQLKLLEKQNNLLITLIDKSTNNKNAVKPSQTIKQKANPINSATGIKNNKE